MGFSSAFSISYVPLEVIGFWIIFLVNFLLFRYELVNGLTGGELEEEGIVCDEVCSDEGDVIGGDCQMSTSMKLSPPPSPPPLETTPLLGLDFVQTPSASIMEKKSISTPASMIDVQFKGKGKTNYGGIPVSPLLRTKISDPTPANLAKLGRKWLLPASSQKSPSKSSKSSKSPSKSPSKSSNGDGIPRPSPHVISQKKEWISNALRFYRSTMDVLLDVIFNFPSSYPTDEKGGTSELLTVPESVVKGGRKVFIENKFGYELREETMHYVMWYVYEVEEGRPGDLEVGADIDEGIRLLLDDDGDDDDRGQDKFDYIWYENPNPTFSENDGGFGRFQIYHVQVFWVRDGLSSLKSSSSLSSSSSPEKNDRRTHSYISPYMVSSMRRYNKNNASIIQHYNTPYVTTPLIKIRLIAFGANFVGWYGAWLPNVYDEEESRNPPFDMKLNSTTVYKIKKSQKTESILYSLLYSAVVAFGFATIQLLFNYKVGGFVGKQVRSIRNRDTRQQIR